MTYKESFIKFMVDCGVLTFGEFTLKSGRIAPYFINCGSPTIDCDEDEESGTDTP